jgi:hypothetical protein
MDSNHAFLLLLAFFIVLLTFHPTRCHIPVYVDLLESSAGFRCIPILVVAAWMRRFPSRFW